MRLSGIAGIDIDKVQLRFAGNSVQSPPVFRVQWAIRITQK